MAVSKARVGKKQRGANSTVGPVACLQLQPCVFPIRGHLTSALLLLYLDRCQRDASGCEVFVDALQLLGPVVGHSYSLNQALAAPRPMSDVELGACSDSWYKAGPTPYWVKVVSFARMHAQMLVPACALETRMAAGTSCAQLYMLHDADPL